ncbi:MAG: hypothetical protein HQM12_17605 [SAR324 cluster bacterium]|nr:hypothetical protein [SAR324 cluster bacterium]
MEEKYENTIHRLKGTAEHPRPLERVPAGVEFDLSISVKVMGDETPADNLAWIWTGMNLIELDGLGGSISRGSGQVEFCDVKLDNNDMSNWRKIGQQKLEKAS